MIKYKIENHPRGSGKTTKLKLEIFETLTKKDGIILLTSYSRNYTKSFENWVIENGINNLVTVFYDEYGLYKSLPCLKNENIIVFIDEPFIMNEDKQSAILNSLEESSKHNNIEIIGYGTKGANKKLFIDYLDE